MAAQTNKHQIASTEKTSATRNVIRFTFAIVLMVALLPLYILNILFSMLVLKAPIKSENWIDIGGEVVELYSWQVGPFKSSANIINVAMGQVHFVGTPIIRGTTSIPNVKRFKSPCEKAGLYDCLQLHRATGLVASDKLTLLEAQAKQNCLQDAMMVLKLVVCKALYKKGGSTQGNSQMFGIPFANTKMHDAINWVCQSEQTQTSCRVGYFLNVNSINLAASNKALHSTLCASDNNFVDGSGMRIAAQHSGIDLADNVNGTDMLPLLCQQAVQTEQSLFLLGAKEGVAEKAGEALQEKYAGLDIRGTQHGYFNSDDDIIEQINQSGATILLVALGSPRQELWLAKNKHRLNCQCALAVGGLFDFFSGAIPRAPLWMREMGLEWVWRLMQEPKTKFNRYVIGNPVFLFRVFILKQSIRGL
ncbi:WecB/TagA/CpsF family glycosyltransferase [Pseudoalteromonas luteoviolacea]|uniref:WecB/TagA/CpsF family glycosyltransferase n=1 Tax=Pseudoalteromonas luteoviolacea TaxID=43657 RepID=UPI001F2B7D75|nr:WecB/TagA/CpsF family glycosyltransferase [Pseudoalteromonas luteoviolacea]MCF6442796.1 WecB/TagA/CpsF family glycosyltransferase [Pseudoalteromonas luteoviolacea]